MDKQNNQIVKGKQKEDNLQSLNHLGFFQYYLMIRCEENKVRGMPSNYNSITNEFINLDKGKLEYYKNGFFQAQSKIKEKTNKH